MTPGEPPPSSERRERVGGLRRRLSHASSEALLRAAAVLALVALGLIGWALVDPSPWAIIASMTLGQALGTLSLGTYLLVLLLAARAPGK